MLFEILWLLLYVLFFKLTVKKNLCLELILILIELIIIYNQINVHNFFIIKKNVSKCKLK